MSKTPVTFRLNGQDAAAFADPGSNLLDFLRRAVGDLSPKYGCGQGTCGACTVLIDGEPHLSCITLAETVSGRDVRTAGGLANGPTLDRLQEAFIDKFAAQCGYCTPGMLMAATALLDKNPNPSRQDVIDAIGGNICRCTGYEPIVDAILEESRNTRGAA
ncbi:MAG: (2Fe-2S)-binding protein [Pseudomonadota bacterium]